MAISPKSKGLGNIGNIVNRQGMASPTKPKPVPKPAPMAKPVTTTLAQRQASQPFRNFTKPAQSKVDPLAQATMQQQSAMMPQPPQPFNPEPNPGQFQIMPLDMFNDYPNSIYNDPTMNFGGQQGPGGLFGQGGGLGNMVGNAVTGSLGQMFGGFGTMLGNAGQQALQQGQGGLGPMFGNTTGVINQPLNMFGNPNPMSSDYDQLEGSAFNTNPSGSLFSGGGFTGQ